MEKTIKTILIGADHRGFKMKEELKRSLSEWGYLVDDVGAHEYKPDDDHPDYARALGMRLIKETSPLSPAKGGDLRGGFRSLPRMIGILICGSGVGIAVAANKIPGIRAGMALTAEQARAACEDSDINVLVLASDFLTVQQARRITKTWLETEFVPKEKYLRRLKKIEELEKFASGTQISKRKTQNHILKPNSC